MKQGTATKFCDVS